MEFTSCSKVLKLRSQCYEVRPIVRCVDIHNRAETSQVRFPRIWDGLDRLTQVTRGSVAAQTTYTYNDTPNQVSVTTTSDQTKLYDNAIKSQVLYDGLARADGGGQSCMAANRRGHRSGRAGRRRASPIAAVSRKRGLCLSRFGLFAQCGDPVLQGPQADP
jgi:hypothetical protein